MVHMLHLKLLALLWSKLAMNDASLERSAEMAGLALLATSDMVLGEEWHKMASGRCH